MEASKKTLVIGASDNPSRYSFLAINKLRQHQHEVIAIGRKKGTVAGVDITTEMTGFDDIDTVTLYINPQLQEGYYNYILSLKPRRIIFNPGTENNELQQLAEDNGIQTLEACTLVMLSTNQY
jgi:predicted CoA-binding protein